jgi:hypothetical protein
MRTPEAIIADLRNTLYWSQPNIKFNELSALINELEALVTPTEEVISSEIVEEIVVEETIPETTEFSIVDIIEEAPVVKEPVVAKKTTKKK